MYMSAVAVGMGVVVGILVISPYKSTTNTTTITTTTSTTNNEYKLFDDTSVNNNTITTRNNNTTSSIITKNVAEFKRQLLVLISVLRSSSLSSFSLVWVVGNSVYTIIYGYEVSLLGAVGGPDDWNGLILSLLLLSGVLLLPLLPVLTLILILIL